MQLEVGNIIEGKVTGITKFGAFVELPGGKTGMVHISEISNVYVKEISDHLAENQAVKVKILAMTDDGKISLSIKKAMDPALQPAPQRGFAPRSTSGAPPSGPRRNTGRPVGWNPKRPEMNDKPTFEDMLAKFKQTSDDKMSDLKRGNEVRRSSRRGNSRP